MPEHTGSHQFTIEVKEPPHFVSISVIGPLVVMLGEDMEYRFEATCTECQGDLSAYAIVVEDKDGQSTKKLKLSVSPGNPVIFTTETIDLYTGSPGKYTYTAKLVSL